MSATVMRTIKPRLLVTDDTQYADLTGVEQFIKKIESVYLYDESQITHCCELAGSHWCEPLYTCIEFYDDVSQEDKEFCYEWWGYPEMEGMYVHAGCIKPTVILEDHTFAEITGNDEFLDCPYEEAFTELVEYYNCNWYYG